MSNARVHITLDDPTPDEVEHAIRYVSNFDCLSIRHDQDETVELVDGRIAVVGHDRLVVETAVNTNVVFALSVLHREVEDLLGECTHDGWTGVVETYDYTHGVQRRRIHGGKVHIAQNAIITWPGEPGPNAVQLRARVEAALSAQGDVSCAGQSVEQEGCFVYDLAQRVRTALEGS